MKKINVFFVFLFIIFTQSFAVAKIFEDNFDDQSFTITNWIQAVPHWQFITTNEMADPIDIGFRGLYNLEDTFAIADSGDLFAIEDLYISIGIKTLYKEIIESPDTPPKDQGGGVVFFDIDSDIGVSATLFYSGDSWIHGAGRAGEEGSVEKELTNIEFNVFYYLELSIDDNRMITSRVLSESGEILSTIEGGLAPNIEFGIVGIGSESDVVFNDFILNARPKDPVTLTQTQVSQLYVSLFGRASEGEGNAYWMAKGGDMASAADQMLGSPAAIAYFGASLDTDQAFVEHIYANTLGKTIAQDPDGIGYWTGRLTAGEPRGSFVKAMAHALASGDFTGDTEAIAAQNRFNNRVEVSNYTATAIAACPDVNDLSAFVDFISIVTHDRASVAAAKQLVDDNNNTFWITPGFKATYLRYPESAKGSAWEVTLKNIGITTEIDGSVFWDMENVTTPAGTFNAAKVTCWKTNYEEGIPLEDHIFFLDSPVT